MYVKFAGSAVVALRRWMDAPEINPEDESAKQNYFDNIFKRHKHIDESIAEDIRRLEELTDGDIAGDYVSFCVIMYGSCDPRSHSRCYSEYMG